MRLSAPRLRRGLGRLRGEPWQRNLYIILLAEMVAMIGFGLSNPFLPFYIQELGVTDLRQVAFWVGLINAAAPISLVLSAPLWGIIGDRHGRKLMLVRSMLGGSLMLGLMAVVANVQQLAILRIVQGALTGTVPAATALVATSVPQERAGYSLGLLQTAIFVGNSLGPFVGGVVGGAFGYRAAFWGSSLALGLGGLLVLFLVREEFAPSQQKRQGNPLAATVRSVGREPLLLTMLALLAFCSLSGTVASPVLPLYVQTMVGSAREASSATGMIVGTMAISNAIAAVWAGRSADRLGRRRVLLACLGTGALLHFPQMLTRHPAELLVLSALTGFAMGGITPVANAIVAEQAPEGHQGSIYGFSHSLNAIGRALGPMLGMLVVTTWWVGGIFPVAGALFALMAIAVGLHTRSWRQTVPPAVECP